MALFLSLSSPTSTPGVHSSIMSASGPRDERSLHVSTHAIWETKPPSAPSEPRHHTTHQVQDTAVQLDKDCQQDRDDGQKASGEHLGSMNAQEGDVNLPYSQ
ncbi:hypothetical protein BZG36_01699 [Bifiguratus adelaidae]|uniref:Uncharacterized protein n=1 Tax=Bifiguratus adelaidae TaxID=1938954 RepID=A0A261Y4K8_9FUNG|nr:hypothetical protein BZG36_01699 [Bifiguratus adelaidae]